MTCYATEQDELLLQQYMNTKDNPRIIVASKQHLTMRDTSIPTSSESPNGTVSVPTENNEDTIVNVDMTDSPISGNTKDSVPLVVSKVSEAGDAVIGAVTHAIKQMKTEVLDEQWGGADKKMMSLELLLNGADAESDQEKDSAAMSPASDEGSRSSQSESERSASSIIECATTGTPPPTAFPVQSRPACAICRCENGRCHASDPLSMTTFFSNSLGFDGTLSTADWLCMKCYSKWYNRCKRKASSLNSISDAHSVPSATPQNISAPPTPRRKRAKETKEKEKRKLRSSKPPAVKEREVPPIEVQPEPEPELLDHDTDSDDALLLTRMTLKSYGHYTGPHGLSNSFNEMEVDELHAELHRMRGEMMRLAQELARRDEQMEGMLKFVKTEMASMHGLLQDIAETRWKRPGTPPQLHPSMHHHVQTTPVVSPTNHIFHLNGKILDNKSIPLHSDSQGNCITPPLSHVHQSDIVA